MEYLEFKTIHQDEYLNNPPFSHIEIDNLWENSFLEKCSDEVSNFQNWQGEKKFYGSQKKRYSNKYDSFPTNIKKLIDEAYSIKFLNWLKSFTGEEIILPDPELVGGGIHSTVKGGFLKIHADFNWNKRLKLYRKLNLLVYLNKKWDDEWGGHLELWSKDVKTCEKKIIPIFNKTVIFSTNDISFHGHPDPVNCPENIFRNSIALYYYSPIKPKVYFGVRDDTDYIERKIDNFRQPNIYKKIYRKFKLFINQKF